MKLNKKLASLKRSIKTVRDELKARSGKSENRHEDLLQFNDAKLREFLVNMTRTKKTISMIPVGLHKILDW